MPGSSIGLLFRVTTFGESHGVLVGAVIDGIPAGLPLSVEDISFELAFRKPGTSPYVSPRGELDKPEVVSGILEGKTTGAPVTIVVRNVDVNSKPYEKLRFTPRPGHADLAYILKYGIENWDYRGGGRASGRETVARVAAGAIAKKLLLLHNTYVCGYLKSLGPSSHSQTPSLEEILKSKNSPVKAATENVEEEFKKLIEEAVRSGDSLGGTVELVIHNPPPGLGEPVFDKLKADLAKALMSIPGAVGFEVGEGFKAATMKGSSFRDPIVVKDGKASLETNKCGGLLGGISIGEPIVVRVAFKPTSSIPKPCKTISFKGMHRVELSVKGRHDPAFVIRAVPVVEAMAAIILVDHMMRSQLLNTTRLSRGEAEIIEERWREYVEKCTR